MANLLYLTALYHFDFRIKRAKSILVGTGSVPASKTEAALVEGRQIAKEIPPLKDLLNIAAMLAIGRSIDDEHLRKIAEQAMKLWAACSDERNQTKSFVSFRTQSLEKELARQNEIPKPRKYPVCFEELLRLWIGGRNKDYRIRIYREYAKEMIWRGHVSAIKYPRNPQSPDEKYAQAIMSDEEAVKLAKPVSSAEIDSVMEQAIEKSIKHEEIYKLHARDFLDWFAKYKATIRQKRAQAGAAGRKKKRQKNGAPE